MSELEMRTTVNEDKVTLEIDMHSLWWQLDDITQELILEESGVWTIIKRAIKFTIGKSLSTPSFYPSLHKLREMICTDSEFVNDITVTFIKQILEEWAEAEQKRRKAERAFWKLYHLSNDKVPYKEVDFPSEIEKEDEYLRVKSNEVKEIIMDKFQGLLKETANEHNYK